LTPVSSNFSLNLYVYSYAASPISIVLATSLSTNESSYLSYGGLNSPDPTVDVEAKF
jgi:hypothetical protein